MLTLEDWKEFAAPKGKDKQWEDGRSAKELAKAWTTVSGHPAPPQNFLHLLASHTAFKDVNLIAGRPEDRIHFDAFRGEPRNADLNLVGESAAGPLVISVEAKADEPYGGTLAQTLAAAEHRIKSGRRSNAAARAQALVKSLLPETVDPSQLPYQLLTAAAATLALAKKHDAKTALLLVHEFINGTRSDGRPATSARKIEINGKALDRFVTALSGGTVTSIVPPTIVGPIRIPGHSRDHTAFYIGKL